MKRRGAAMIWACLLLLLGTIMVATMVTLGISYHQKAVDEMIQNQAYITARSGAEVVAKSIEDKTESGKTIADKVRAKEEVNIKDMNFGDGMGQCSIKILSDGKNPEISEEDAVEGRFTIISTAEKNGAKDTVKIVMKETELGGKIDDIFLGSKDDIVGGAINQTIWEWIKKLVKREEMPDIQSPLNAIELTGGNIQVGEPGKSTYYYFDKNTKVDSITQNNIGNGNVYIYIKNGANVTIDSIVGYSTADKPKINVFIIIEKGGKLYLNLKTDSYVYVYAKYGGVKINGAKHKLYGGITCYSVAEDIVFSGNAYDVLPGYPNADISGGGPGGSGGGYNYEVINYGN